MLDVKRTNRSAVGLRGMPVVGVDFDTDDQHCYRFINIRTKAILLCPRAFWRRSWPAAGHGRDGTDGHRRRGRCALRFAAASQGTINRLALRPGPAMTMTS